MNDVTHGREKKPHGVRQLGLFEVFVPLVGGGEGAIHSAGGLGVCDKVGDVYQSRSIISCFSSSGAGARKRRGREC